MSAISSRSGWGIFKVRSEIYAILLNILRMSLSSTSKKLRKILNCHQISQKDWIRLWNLLRRVNKIIILMSGHRVTAESVRDLWKNLHIPMHPKIKHPEITQDENHQNPSIKLKPMMKSTSWNPISWRKKLRIWKSVKKRKIPMNSMKGYGARKRKERRNKTKIRRKERRKKRREKKKNNWRKLRKIKRNLSNSKKDLKMKKSHSK